MAILINGDGPVAMITGASSGIGEAIAREASRTGYRIALLARRKDRIRRLADELGAPGRALAVTADVRDFRQQAEAVEETIMTFGRLDAAIANAGLGAPRGFTESSPDHWEAMVATNVLGVAFTVRATIDELARRRGHLVLISSIAGRKTLKGSLYSATKHAVSALGECVRGELDGTGARVTVIEPGTVDTPYFATPPPVALAPADVARAVMFALTQPEDVDVSNIFLRPTLQPT